MSATANELPQYDQASAALDLAGIEPSVAEVHGIICGVLVSPGAGKVDWLATVLGGDSEHLSDLPKAVSQQLLAMFQLTRDALQKGEFGLNLLLPDAELHDIVFRTDALAAWCRGFLLGLAEGGLTDFTSLSNEARDALEDLIDIAEVEAQEAEDEQQEQALAEVEEYVRVAVQFLFDELQLASR
jgi:yecA family protein